MLNALGLFEKDGQILVSSVDVAENFLKRHKNVVRAIENLKCGEEFNRLNFEPVEYKDEKGEMRPAYTMTRDGFTLLVMGFTGYRAMEWKVKYIKAFNAMEARLKEGAAREAALPEAQPSPQPARKVLSSSPRHGLHSSGGSPRMTLSDDSEPACALPEHVPR